MNYNKKLYFIGAFIILFITSIINIKYSLLSLITYQLSIIIINLIDIKERNKNE